MRDVGPVRACLVADYMLQASCNVHVHGRDSELDPNHLIMAGISALP